MSDNILARIEALERRVATIEGLKSDKEATTTNQQSPREYLLSKNVSSALDKTLLAGYYIETVIGKASFNLDDLSAFFNTAKEQIPKNRRDAPYQLVKKGYFREVGNRVQASTARNEWSLTNSGMKRVEDNFPKEG